MSQAVFETIKYWKTHSFPPVLDGIEILNNPSSAQTRLSVVSSWRRFVSEALSYDDYLSEASRNLADGKPIAIRVQGLDEYQTAREAFGGTNISRREALAATLRVFDGLRENKQIDKSDLEEAKKVAGTLLDKLIRDPVV